MVSRRLVVIARIYLGIVFCVAAIGKFTNPVDFTASMLGFLTNVTLHGGFPWYVAFVRAAVVPHDSFVALLVLAGESCVGVGLLFGLCTRICGGVAMLLLLNYLCAKGVLPWSPGSNDMADIVLALIVVLGNGGRAFGLDRHLHEKFPRAPVF